MSPIDLAIAAGELPPAVKEHRFCPGRKWRFDYCWVDVRPPVALEIEGGTWARGRHVRGRGYARDTEKYSMAAILGWCVIRATTEQVESGQALQWVKQALELREGE